MSVNHAVTRAICRTPAHSSPSFKRADLFAEKLHDAASGHAGGKGRYFGRREPFAPHNFVAGLSRRGRVDLGEENIMLRVEAFELEQVDEPIGGESRFFVQLPRRGIMRRFIPTDSAARQCPSRPCPCDQQDTVVPNAQNGCPVFHSLLPLAGRPVLLQGRWLPPVTPYTSPVTKLDS